MLEFNLTPFPELKTARLILRRISENDAKDFFAIRSNQLIMEKLDKELAPSIEEVMLLIRKIENAIESNLGINWALCLKEDNKLIGVVGFHNIYKDHHRADIGYALLPEFQRKGIMKEAIEVMINFAFKELKLHSIEAKVNPNNQASIKLLSAFGFEKEAILKQSYYFKQQFLDTAIYSLLTTNYISSKV